MGAGTLHSVEAPGHNTLVDCCHGELLAAKHVCTMYVICNSSQTRLIPFRSDLRWTSCIKLCILLLVICKPCVSKSSEHSKTHKPGTANAANPSAKTKTKPVTVVSTLRRRLTLPFALLAYVNRVFYLFFVVFLCESLTDFSPFFSSYGVQLTRSAFAHTLK